MRGDYMLIYVQKFELCKYIEIILPLVLALSFYVKFESNLKKINFTYTIKRIMCIQVS